jgi:sugar/nucleoside kinase (ribokinase family)
MRALLFFLFLATSSHIQTAEILTISDSILDYIIHVSEDYVETLPGKKGGCELIDDLQFQTIIRESNVHPIVRPGGSGVNTIKGLQHLGHHCGVITTLGDDFAGDFFLKNLHSQGLKVYAQKSLTPTGKSVCLVTSNGERTMRTSLGASQENGAFPLHAEMFQGINHFHLEGYQLKHRSLIQQALIWSKENRASVSLDLGSFEIVEKNKEFIWDLLHEAYIDILFANQSESFSLTGLPPQEAANLLATCCKLAVITMGAQGCCVSQGQQQWHCPAAPVEIIDTIGAGDLFISGFLHGVFSGQPIPHCAQWGTLLASHVVQVYGAEIPEDPWKEIANKLISCPANPLALNVISLSRNVP